MHFRGCNPKTHPLQLMVTPQNSPGQDSPRHPRRTGQETSRCGPWVRSWVAFSRKKKAIIGTISKLLVRQVN